MIPIMMAVLVGVVCCSSANMKNDLFVAVNSGDLTQVKTIVEQDPGLRDAYLNDGWTALTVAAREGNVHVVNLLIDEGVDVNRREGGGNSALFWAVYYGHEDVVSALLRSGARIDNKCSKCPDPIDVARDKQNLRILRLLTEQQSRL